jgi:hypothetical protein
MTWTQITEYIFSNGRYLLINSSKKSWSLYRGTMTDSFFLVQNEDSLSMKEAVQWAEKYIQDRESKTCLNLNTGKLSEGETP